MANTISSVVELRMDISKAVLNVTELSRALDGLRKTAGNVGAAISKAFAPMVNSLNGVQAGINDVSAKLVKATEKAGDGSNAAEGINSIFSGIAEGYERVTQAFDKVVDIEKYSISFQDVFEKVVTTPNMGTLLKDLFPKSTELASTVSSWVNNDLLGTIISALGENGGTISTAATNMLTGITGAFQKVGGALSGLSVGWGAAIGGIIALIVLLITNWDSIQAAVTEGFSAFMDSAGGAWESLYNIVQPVIDFFRTTINDLWEKHLKPFWDNLCAAFKSIGEGITTIWNEILMPVINWIIGILAPAIISVIDIIIGAISVVVGFIADVVGGIFEVIGGLIKFIAGVFTGDWEKAWEGIVGIFKGIFDGIVGIVKGVFNGIIWAINILIAAIYSAIAGVLNGIGGVAKFIGNIFGQDWGFSVPSNPPQIPYLAKGAVLPANRPFLAVVGDQRHGTNVEAPLATIQEAVALVLEDHIGAMMAGFEALLKEQQATRRTIEGIEIGDTVIGRAAERYGRKMAVVRGGY